MKLLRYIMVLPAALLGWVAGALITLQLDYLRVVLWCPPSLREGQDCYAEGWDIFPTWLLAIGTALSAGLVVLCVAITAPQHKLRLAINAYLVGVAGATTVVILARYFVIPYLTALMAGGLAVLLVSRLTGEAIRANVPFVGRARTVK